MYPLDGQFPKSDIALCVYAATHLEAGCPVCFCITLKGR